MNASNNQISRITSAALNDLDSLKLLDISNNKLTRLPDNQFASLAAVESINISQNQLTFIQPFTFTDLRTLKTLDLSSNQLSTDHFLELVAQIKSINLQHNKYQQIDLSAFKLADSVYLNDNPWNCSWLFETLATKKHSMANIRFELAFDGILHANLTKPLAEEVECFDYQQSQHNATIKRIILINYEYCGAPKNSEGEKKVKICEKIF